MVLAQGIALELLTRLFMSGERDSLRAARQQHPRRRQYALWENQFMPKLILKAKPASQQPASTNQQRRRTNGHATQQQQFSAAVGDIAKRYGVKVASIPAPVNNPYAMPPEQAVKVALQAGIITRSGKLTRTFR